MEEISYISLISLEGYGEFPAVEEAERLGVKSQKDKEKLEQATKNIYKAEYHKGIFKIEPTPENPCKRSRSLLPRK